MFNILNPQGHTGYKDIEFLLYLLEASIEETMNQCWWWPGRGALITVGGKVNWSNSSDQHVGSSQTQEQNNHITQLEHEWIQVSIPVHLCWLWWHLTAASVLSQSRCPSTAGELKKPSSCTQWSSIQPLRRGRVWAGERAMVKNVYCSCRFGFRHPCHRWLITASNPIIPFPGASDALGFCGHLCVYGTHKLRHTQIKTKFKKDLKMTMYEIIWKT